MSTATRTTHPRPCPAGEHAPGGDDSQLWRINPDRPEGRIYDPAQVTALLRQAQPQNFAAASIEKICVARFWPGAQSGFSAELHVRDHSGITGTWFVRQDDAGGTEVLSPQAPVFVHTHEDDPVFSHLPACLDAARVARELSAGPSAGASMELAEEGHSCRLLGYKPGRCAAIEYRLATRADRTLRLAGKTFCHKRGRRFVRWTRQVNKQLADIDRGVRLPSPVGHIPDLHLGLYEYIEPSSQASQRVSIEKLVSVAAALHQTRPEGIPQFTLDRECGVLLRWERALAHALPTAADLIDPMIDNLIKIAGRLDPGQPVTIHRDYYDKQIIPTPDATYLLDLDTLASGPGELDLGNLTAHLALDAIIDGATPELEEVSERVLEEYARRFRPADRRRFDFFTATSLLRLGMVYALRDTGRHQALQLWQLADRWIGRLEDAGRTPEEA